MTRLELILGVIPQEEYADSVDRYIRTKYPDGPGSMLLELPEYEDIHADVFSTLEKRYKELGTKIIYGDLNREKTPPYILELKKSRHLTPRSIISVLFYYSKISLGTVLDARYFHKRAEGMINAVKREKPQVVVVSRIHADYLKKKYPCANYTAFISPDENIESIVKLILPETPFEPDEVIKLEFPNLH